MVISNEKLILGPMILGSIKYLLCNLLFQGKTYLLKWDKMVDYKEEEYLLLFVGRIWSGNLNIDNSVVGTEIFLSTSPSLPETYK